MLRMKAVERDFFEQPTLELARALLGMVLVKETAAGAAAGRIVETEAYKGPEDRAAHSFGNRRTSRTEVMFGPPGYAYTHRIHTHCLINVVSAQPGQPESVLIRALEPIEGIELMRLRRGCGTDKPLHELARGPGNLTKALAIGMEDYGRPLDTAPLYIAVGAAVPGDRISVGPRVGIPNSGEAVHYPWRFWEAGNRCVSRPLRTV